MTRWTEYAETNIPDFLLGEHPLIAKTLVRRGFSTPEQVNSFLNPGDQATSSAFSFPGMEAAVSRIQLAIRRKETICVWGDFDVDGQTSTALLVETLQALGADVRYHIPIRAVSSHGVHIPQLSELIERGVNLVLTCDTGINAHEAVNHATSHKVDFIISDHHDPGDTLPPAVAVLNPKCLPKEHPLAYLAGVGVAYKLAKALQTSNHDQEIEKLLDLVALGLIADVALLRGDTRVLAYKGLNALRTSKRVGLQMIAEFAQQPLGQATGEYIGFVLGPRLNALGRLGDANPAVELLTTNDKGRARILAAQLEGLNSQRRLLTNQVYQAAENQLNENPSLKANPAIILGHPAWPGGIVGIVASRLKDRYNKPVILFNTPEGEPARGSARSIEGLHISKAIAAQQDLLLGFGGHPMAAGLALQQENLPIFRKRLNATIEDLIGEAGLEEPFLQIDAWLGLDELSFELVETLERLAPFGAGNPTPILASKDVHLKAASKFGRLNDHQRITIEDSKGNSQRLLWWNSAHETLPEAGSRIEVAYTLRATTFRGARQLTLELKDIHEIDPEPVEIIRKQLEVIDLRQDLERYSKLNYQTYVEGDDKDQIGGMDRYGLQPSRELVIFTCPPGYEEMREILELVNPREVYLICKNPPPVQTENFLAQLAGMAKYVITQKGGKTRISKLAAATAQREITLRIALEWLVAGGHITISSTENLNGEEDAILLEAGNSKGNPFAQRELFISIKGLLEETEAFRKYLLETKDPISLFG